LNRQRHICDSFFNISACCLILLALFAEPVHSQTYNFKTFSLDEGLSQSEISCMLEDSRGYLWLGTNGGGVCKFDGKEFQTFEEKDGLSGQLVTGMAEDKKGNIWISTTWGGISCFNGKKFLTVAQKDGLRGNRFDHIAVDDQNNVILCSHSAISIFDGKKARLISDKIEGMNNNDVTCLYKDKKGNIWLGTSNGVFVLKGQELHDFRGDKELSRGEIISISGDDDGNIYYVKAPGKFFMVNTLRSPSFGTLKAEPIDSISLPSGAEISSIHIDRRNQFWITTNNQGLFKYFKGTLMHFDTQSGLPNNAIRNIYEDHTGCFWIGTSGSGFVRFMDQTFTYYDNLEGFRSGDVFALCCDRKNTIWASSVSQGLFSFDGQKLSNYNSDPVMKGFIARCIFCDHKGNLWIGGPKGVRIYDGKKFSVFKVLPDSLNINVSVFAEDSYGNIWMGTRGQGAFRFNGTKTSHFNAALGLKNPYVYSICEDNSGNMWLGTGNGVYKYASEKFQVFSTESGICNSYIGSMVKDKLGNLWMGTDNCVTINTGKAFQSISTNEGLSSGTVYLLNVDDYGNIWVGTNKGADEIILNSNGQIKMIRNFGKTEGFKGIECNSRSTCLDNSGNIWFGTVKGVIRYNPREERELEELPSVHIARARLFYENTDWEAYSDSISSWDHLPLNAALPYDKNHITFDFKAVNKTAPENIKYSFILKGFDRDWSPETQTPFATYSNLPPGNYTFRVKAANKRDGWNETPAEFSFTIRKPFWTTWWFIGLCCLCLSACMYAYNELRKRRELAKREELEKVIQLRTFELTRQKEEKEVLLKEIHHRVKNNLQVINSLISIQSSFVEDPKSLDVFEECKNRIRAIALIHEKLYKSDDFGRINIKDYIQMLVQNMIETYNINKRISLILDLKIEYLNLNTTVPLGLLLNEIISNSFKYAFTGIDRGEIVIRLNTASNANSFVLIIGDNGKGYSGDPFEENSLPSLGLELVKILSDQLNGKIEKIPMDGTYYKLIFHSLKN
jgi:two-component sensor histidine kinase/ligand-binding sensor domain-containing protein